MHINPTSRTKVPTNVLKTSVLKEKDVIRAISKGLTPPGIIGKIAEKPKT